MHLDKEYLDKLSGKDLSYPQKKEFTTLYVYHRGTVLAIINATNIVEEATILDAKLEELGIAVGNKGLPENISELPQKLFSLGVVVEKVVNTDVYRMAKDGHDTIIRARVSEWKKELYEYYGVTDNPKADAVYEKAYDRGHSYGYGEVSSSFGNLVDLII